MTASKTTMDTAAFKTIADRNKSKKAQHAQDNKVDVIAVQELDLKNQRNELLSKYLESVTTFVGACVPKSVSNELCSRLCNDNFNHQITLVAAEIIAVAYEKLPLAPALELFNIEENKFLKAVHDCILLENASVQDLVTPIISLAAFNSVTSNCNPNAVVDLTGEDNKNTF